MTSTVLRSTGWTAISTSGASSEASRSSSSARAGRWSTMRDRYGPAMRLSDPELARIGFAAATLQQHCDREYFFLDLAVHAPDDESSRRLELYADDAYRDARAVATEHGLCL